MQVSETQLELKHWLDKILSEPEDEDFKATRRLFFGMNLEEEKRDAKKLSAEIIDRVYAILHSKSAV